MLFRFIAGMGDVVGAFGGVNAERTAPTACQRVAPTLDALSAFLTTRLRHYSPARLRSLTGFPSFVATTHLANGYSS